MRNITVIGTGYVGLVSGACFAEIGHNVVCSDIDKIKIENLNKNEIPIYEPGLKELVEKNLKENRLSFTTDIAGSIKRAEIIFIAVGTPMALSGEADLKFVKEVAETIANNIENYTVIVNKSTVPVGTAALVENIIRENLKSAIDFDVISNPEFLREGSAVSDFMHMERVIIGHTSEKAAQIVEELHSSFKAIVYKTDPLSSEMIKYAANAFLATKISFINSIANICDKVGANVTDVAIGIGLDSRIGNKFLNAGIGYGGSCFPKDTQALLHISESKGYNFSLLRSVIETNESQKYKIIEILQRVFGEIATKTITVLGLTFKPDTDDMRCAPSLDIIPALLNLGAYVKCYDPVGLKKAAEHLPPEVQLINDLYDAAYQADAIVILTEWEEIVKMDLDKVRSLMKSPILIDGRNCFDLSFIEESQFAYYSIGRPAINPKSNKFISN